MLTTNEKELSNLSYTNKDFGTIYPELLDLVSKLSYKWNPSESDESDPGVILLKLAALMADKNNYNIDKNILELFPLSVTQLQNARQLYEQLGYTMAYYQSATTDVQLTMTNPPLPSETDYEDLGINAEDVIEAETYFKEHEMLYILPRFTMLSTPDNNIVYTLLEEVCLSSNGVSQICPAIQGTANKYMINGEELITSINLDYNNRIYFTELDIAENGIFINQTGMDDWTRVDNLVIQAMGTKCFKFGLTDDGTKCYIEFPSDIENIIGEGVYITYIRTSGSEGNISRKKLSQFYVDTTATRYLVDRGAKDRNTQSIVVSAENINIGNISSAINGKNPETIDEAYIGYQKVKNTFGTLVGLKDYSDFMISNHNVSNGYVCDRTNDPECTYKLLNTDTQKTQTIVHNNTGTDIPVLDAFDLKVYALAYIDNTDDVIAFNESFRVLSGDTSTVNDLYNLHSNITGWGELKTIQHNFAPYLGDKILLIKNKYFIDAKVIPQYKVTSLQANDIKDSIRKALYNTLNSKVLKFGEAIPYDVVYDAIINSDPRIKALVLQDIEYHTYASYYDAATEQIKEIRIDNQSSKPSTLLSAQASDEEKMEKDHEDDLWEEFRKEVYVRSVLSGKTQFLISDSLFNHSINEDNSQEGSGYLYVDTDTTVTAVINGANSGSEPSRKLMANENMVFTAPNLIDDIPFSNYCKFIYKLKNASGNIIKESMYTLQDDEYIVFLWKTDDDPNTPYSYRKYTSSTDVKTICPTFTISNTQPSFIYSYYNEDVEDLTSLQKSEYNLIADTEFFKELPATGSSGVIGTIRGVISFTDNKQFDANAFISKIAGSSFQLTGTNQITTKKPHTIHINNKDGNGTDRVYWILNNKTATSKYKLFDKTFEKSQSYTLQTGEYFIYGNSSQTQLIMLSSGTKITRSSDYEMEIWEVPAISYDEFIKNPFKALEDNWKIIPNKINLYATEQEFYQIGPGYQVLLRYKTDPEGYSMDNPHYIDFHNSYITYRDGTTINGTTLEGDAATLDGIIITLIDDNDTVVDPPLSYRNNSEFSWVGKTLLNLNCSNTSPQLVTANQTVIFYSVTSDDTDALKLPISINGKATDTYLLTDTQLNLAGGTKIDITSVDLMTGTIEPLNAYVYTASAPTSEMSDVGVTSETWQVSFNGANDQMEITLPTKTEIDSNSEDFGNYIFPITLPKGSYVIPITISPFGIDALTIYFNPNRDDITNQAGKIDLVDITSTSEYNEAGLHHLLLDLSKQSSELVSGYLCINFENSSAENTSILEVGVPYKYRYEHGNIARFDDILSLLNEYNNYNGQPIFNYTYQVPEEDLIEDPLIAKEFLDAGHPFNPFTICQWDTTNKTLNSLIIENKIK